MKQVLTQSLAILILLSGSVVGLEPIISSAASAEDQFTITQVITSEISFLVPSADVTMSPSIGAITGGTSYGSTTVRVYTNNATGYTMTIKASSSPAMQGNANGGTITDYTAPFVASSTPEFTFSVPTGFEFGYTITASTTADLAQKFKDNGTVCSFGSADTSGSASCWYGLSTTATSTIVTTAPTAGSGSTSTVVFQLKVNANSVLTQDTYTATTTLTATTN